MVDFVHEFFYGNKYDSSIIDIYRDAYSIDNMIEFLNEHKRLHFGSYLKDKDTNNILSICTCFYVRSETIVIENLLCPKCDNDDDMNTLKEKHIRILLSPGTMSRKSEFILASENQKQTQFWDNLKFDHNNPRPLLNKIVRKNKKQKFFDVENELKWDIFECKTTKISYKTIYTYKYPQSVIDTSPITVSSSLHNINNTFVSSSISSQSNLLDSKLHSLGDIVSINNTISCNYDSFYNSNHPHNTNLLSRPKKRGRPQHYPEPKIGIFRN